MAACLEDLKSMAHYRADNRETLQFLTGSLDLLLPGDSVARAIWTGLEQLDFSSYDSRYKNDMVGRSAVNPRSLVGVWILGMLRGVTSSLRLTDLCEQDIEFRWLLGDSRVKKSALCDFRKKYQSSLISLSTQVLSALGRNGLLPGTNMGVDGTIVRAASSRHSVKRRKGLESQKQQLSALIEEKLSQSDSGESSEEVQALSRRHERLAKALEEMTSRGLDDPSDRITVTEPDAPLMRQKDGSFAPGYNAQAVTDLSSGAIIHAERVDSGSDGGQLQPQVERAQAVLREVVADQDEAVGSSIVADGGYHDTLQLEALEHQGVACYVPDGNNNRHAPGISAGYEAQAFCYDAATDTMCCPQGHALHARGLNNGKTAMTYLAKAGVCQSCPAKPQCCPKTKLGRSVNRCLYTETLEKVEQRLASAEGTRQKRARQIVCEGAFARLKELLHWRRCSMWGRAGAEAELLWRQFAHNLLLLLGVWKPIVPMENMA